MGFCRFGYEVFPVCSLEVLCFAVCEFWRFARGFLFGLRDDVRVEVQDECAVIVFSDDGL